MADDNESTSPGEHLPETRSRCITESVAGTLYLEVINYKQLENMERDEYVASDPLRLGGYDWKIRLYPHATRGLYASAYLYCSVRGKGVRAKFTLNVLDKSQTRLNTCFDEMDFIFSTETYWWGHDEFVRKNMLKWLPLAWKLWNLDDGSFTVRCDLTVINESPPLELLSQLERILGDGTGTDVTFDVAGEMIRAHRFMLAASSPVFYGQLFGPMKEKDMHRVEVPDMEPHIFEMLLQFIYTGSLPASGDGECYGAPVMQHLLVAADRYGMEKLKLACEEKLGKMIDVQTVITTLVLADQHLCKGLKDACVDFMSSPGVLDAIMAANEFENLMETCPYLALEESLKDKLSVFAVTPDHNEGAASSSSGAELEITSSRCITESITATFNFKVMNYPQLKDMDVGAYISSPIFRVGGHNWTVNFYPNGENRKNRGKASAFLFCLSEGKGVVSTKYTLELLQKEGQVQEDNCLEEIYETFSESDPTSGGYGHHILANKKKLKSLSLLDDGCLTIRCVLTVMESSPLPEVHDNLERILRDSGGTDVTFIVGGQPFRAHRAFLVLRSPIFKAQLFDPDTEKDIECVEVVDMEPDTFKMLIYFVYTDLLHPSSNDDGHHALVLQRLFVAADRYGLDRLKLMCEDELCKKIDVETVAVTFALADRHKSHHCEQLRSACLNFMACPEVLDTILANNGLKNLHLGTH